MKYQFSTIEVKDLEGAKLEDANLHKTIANALYKNSPDLDLVDKAGLMNKGEEVELDKVEIEVLKKLVKDPKTGLFAFAQKAVLDYIDSVKEVK